MVKTNNTDEDTPKIFQEEEETVKKSFKRGLALFLAVVLVATTGYFSSDNWLKASDEKVEQDEKAEAVEKVELKEETEETEQTDESIPADSDAETQPEAGETEPAEDGQETVPEDAENAGSETGETPDAEPTGEMQPEGGINDTQQETPVEDAEEKEDSAETDPADDTASDEETKEDAEDVQQDGTVVADAEENLTTKSENVEEEETEPEMPAQTLEAETEDVDVTVDAKEGILPEGTTIDVKTVDNDDISEAIMAVLREDNLTPTEIKAVDITLLDKDGNAVQPTSDLTVKFGHAFDTEIPGTSAAVYHVDGDQVTKVTDVDCESEDVEFTTNHFSVYAAVKVAPMDVADEPMTLEENETYEIKDTYTIYVGDSNFSPVYVTNGWSHSYNVERGDEFVTVAKDGKVTAKKVGEAIIKHTRKVFFEGEKEEYFKIIVLPVIEKKYTITYNLNGGSGNTPMPTEGKQGDMITLPSGEGISRSNYELLGWATSTDASTVNNGSKNQVYGLESEYEISSNQTLYAVWGQMEGNVGGMLTIAIRQDGVIPDEPSIQNAAYTHIVGTNGGGIRVNNLLDYFSPLHTVSGVANVEKGLTEKFYNLVKESNSGSKYWNEDTQYVVWYVIKYQDGDKKWHIDGVVRDKSKVNLDYDGNGATSGLAPDGHQYVIGKKATVSDNTYNLEKMGYDFAGWNTKADGSGTTYQPGAEITMTENVTLYAKWEPKNTTAYKVEHYQQNLKGTEYELVETETLRGWTDATVSAIPKEYSGFTYNSEILGTVAEGVVAADGSLVLKLYYVRNEYTVRYNLDGGESTTEKLVYIKLKYGIDTPKIEDPTKTGYTFNGWTPVVAENVTEDATYTASWSPIIYHITYDWGEPAEDVTNVYSLPVDGTEYIYGDDYTVDPTQYEPVYLYDEYGNVNGQYTFSGWNTEDGIITDNLTITGEWTYKNVEVKKHHVIYNWTGLPSVILYNEGGEEVSPEVPVDKGEYVKGQTYIVDSTLTGTVVYTKDELGNNTASYTLGEWNKIGEQIMGDEEPVNIEAKWTPKEIEVPTWTVRYTWDGDVPEDKYAQTKPEGGTYKNNAPYEVDTKYTKDYSVTTYDAYGNANGVYKFSGWDQKSGIATSNLEIKGTWTYEETEVATYNVTYSWTGLPENETLYDAAGEETIPQLPASLTGLVENQPYTVDSTMPGTVVYTKDEYGNNTATYTLSAWDRTGEQKMGKEPVNIEAKWTPEEIEVLTWTVSYAWDGNVPEGEYAQTKPEGGTYKNNAPYEVDTKYTKDYSVTTYDAYGNANGVYKFSGWDQKSGIATSNLEIKGTWTYEETEVATYNVTYSWTGLPENETLYDAGGNEIVLQRPESLTGLVKNQPYTVDSEKPGTTVYTKDKYGNNTASYTLSNWNKTGEQIMGEASVEISATWNREEIEVPSFTVSYAFTGNVPAGKVAPESATYYLNQPVIVAENPIADGYKFSGWDRTSFDMPNENVTITGNWSADFSGITATGFERVYNGNSDEVKVGETIPGDQVEYFIDGKKLETNSFKDVTNSEVTVKVTRGNETHEVKATVKIDKKALTLRSADLSQVYNGKWLSNGTTALKIEDGWVKGESAPYNFTGYQFYVGSSENTFEILWDDVKATAKKGNYTVQITPGTLEVTTSKDDQEIDPNLVVTKKHIRTRWYKVGDVITFTIRVTNIFDETKNVTVTEQPGVTIIGEDSAVLASGATAEFKAQYTVKDEDIVNGTFTNTVTVDFGDVTISNEDEVTEFVKPVPKLSITKEVIEDTEHKAPYGYEETVAYGIRVFNEGTLTLTNVQVKDELTGDNWTIDSLAPGEKSDPLETSYIVNDVDILNGEVVNTATASGSYEGSTKPVEATATETVQTVAPYSHLTLIKETTSKPANGNAYVIGETITYEITAVNDGNQRLTNIEITDALTGDKWGPIAKLAQGETSTVFTASHTVTEEDILNPEGKVTNVVTATATTPDTEPDALIVIPGIREDVVAKAEPSLSVIKTITSEKEGGYGLGDEISYEIEVTNNGNLTVNDISVTDELTGDTWTVGTLGQNEKWSEETTYTVEEKDILAGTFVNTAVASGTASDGTKVEDFGEVTANMEAKTAT